MRRDLIVRRAVRNVVALTLLAGSLLGPALPAGAEDGRIVGGTVAPEGAWPAQAALVRNGPGGASFTCGGTVIARTWVLTAAHCVNRPDADPAHRFLARPADIDVLVGTQDLRSGGTRIHSAEIRVHPGWDYDLLRNDVALIRLDRPVPTAIVPQSLASATPAAGTAVTAVGWGDTAYGAGTGSPVLRQVEVDVQTDGRCAQVYGSLYQAGSMVCVDRNPGGTCQGDSGGPTLVPQGDTWVQVGITSWAYRCGNGYPSVLARVSSFSTWIRWQIRYGPHPDATAFVRQQHLDISGRPPTSGELVSGVAGLEGGQATADHVADLLEGDAFRARSGGVIRLYESIFLRGPDSGGLTYWVGEVDRGVSLKRIADLMVRAPEFVTRYGHLDDAGFVDLVYDNVLDRLPSVADRSYWVGELAAGRRTRGQVMVGFSESAEHRALTDATTRVTAAFWALVRRVPTPTEMSRWTGRPTGDIARFLLSSWTYAHRF
jgi:hypothetical protein